jgi:hypothetical protein
MDRRKKTEPLDMVWTNALPEDVLREVREDVAKRDMLGKLATETLRMRDTGENLMTQEEYDAQYIPTGEPIGKEEINEAIATLEKYRSGKAILETRVIEDDRWWRLRHTECNGREGFGMQYPSSYLFSSIQSKHAAAMENYPEPNVLARQQDDEEEAKTLSEIIPVILEANDFKETYSLNQWRKAQNGNSVYGVFWNAKKLNGTGDVDIRPINILNIFWEPGITDLQLSRNIFTVEIVHKDDLAAQYPQAKDVEGSGRFVVQNYITEDNIDKTDKVAVVDWYYRRMTPEGRTVLHYCKFVNDIVLFSSENQGMESWYDDGNYPFVFDRLFPMEGSPAGFGYIDTGKASQEQIDLYNQAILNNALASARQRYFISNAAGINEEEFADYRRQLVHVEGMMSENYLLPIPSTTVSGIVVDVMQQKINELKETTSNQDVMTGSAKGITAASAIQALQETAGMPNKDATRGTYRAFEEIVRMVIERIRQFYDTPRTFRIVGEHGEPKYVQYDASGIQPQPQGQIFGQDMGYRLPEFDIEVVAQSETAYTKLQHNTTIFDLMDRGIFNPQNADVALAVLDSLDIDDKDKIIDKVQQNGTLLEKVQNYGQLAIAIAQKYGDAMLAQQIAQQLQIDGAGANPQAPVGEPLSEQKLGMSAADKANETKEAKTRAQAQNTMRV